MIDNILFETTQLQIKVDRGETANPKSWEFQEIKRKYPTSQQNGFCERAEILSFHSLFDLNKKSFNNIFDNSWMDMDLRRFYPKFGVKIFVRQCSIQTETTLRKT